MAPDKENTSNISTNKADERRQRLEEYRKAKQAQKKAEKRSVTSKGDRTTHKNAPKSNIPNPQEVELVPIPTRLDVQSKIDDGDTRIEPPYEQTKQKTIPESQTDVDSAQNVDILQKVEVNEDLSSAEILQRVTLPKETIIIDWSRPVFLQQGNGVLKRLTRPGLRLFRTLQIEKVLESNQFGLAQIMLSVLAAPKQCWRQDARRSAPYWQLYMKTYITESLETILKQASKYLSSEQIFILQNFDRFSSAPPRTPSRLEIPSSPKTPEITLPPESAPPQTPEDDEVTRQMQAEIDDVVRRTPAIQQRTPPRNTAALLQKAVTAIKDTRLYRDRFTVKSNTQEPMPTVEGGSAYLYAMVTPSKRVRDMLETEAAISPVRRSKRLLEKNPTGHEQLFSKLDEIPNLAAVGFIPNANVVEMPDTDHRRTRVKADPHSLSLLGTPSKRVKQPRLDNDSENEQEEKNPFQ